MKIKSLFIIIIYYYILFFFCTIILYIIYIISSILNTYIYSIDMVTTTNTWSFRLHNIPGYQQRIENTHKIQITEILFTRAL